MRLFDFLRVILDSESMDYFFDKSKYGNPVLVIGAQRFKFSKATGNTKRWLCIKTGSKCSAFVVTENETIVRMSASHTH